MNLFGYAKEVKELFKKFYDMEPYLFIDEKEWQHIITTYEKDDVVDELAKCLHTYPCPIPKITEKESKEFEKTKRSQVG